VVTRLPPTPKEGRSEPSLGAEFVASALSDAATELALGQILSHALVSSTSFVLGFLQEAKMVGNPTTARLMLVAGRGSGESIEVRRNELFSVLLIYDTGDRVARGSLSLDLSQLESAISSGSNLLGATPIWRGIAEFPLLGSADASSIFVSGFDNGIFLIARREPIQLRQPGQYRFSVPELGGAGANVQVVE
jgi:hypothetical protein